ncbi:MAG: sigma-54-dependent transcriptional regulator [Gammaproteobacteria bacterium]
MSKTEISSETRPADSAPCVLIVDDEEVFARAVCKRLTRTGYQCIQASNLAAARAELERALPALLVLDMRLPDGSGLAFLETLRAGPMAALPVLVITAHGEVEDAVAAMKLQARDYLKKPLDLEDLTLAVERVLAKDRLDRALEYSQARERHGVAPAELLGEDRGMQAVRAQIERLAQLAGGTAAPTVLILGETGTGKDLVARRLHQVSRRVERPFVHVDCAALPKDLIEAELFGHEKGAFTSAIASRAGLIEAAEDGVLFLDEIGELPLELQAKLLAVLERRSLRRIGSTRERRVEAWLMAATNRDPEQMVAAGRLRADLYYRLHVIAISLPPLRSRGADKVLLAQHFATQAAQRYGFDVPELSAGAAAAIEDYHWPGNVRELKHLMERVVLLAGGGRIEAEVLFLPGTAYAPTKEAEPPRDNTLAEAERRLIEQALTRAGNNVSEAARQLGVTRMAMRYRMKKYGL